LTTAVAQVSPLPVNLTTAVAQVSPLAVSLTTAVAQVSPLAVSLTTAVAQVSPLAVSLTTAVAQVRPLAVSLTAAVAQVSPLPVSLAAAVAQVRSPTARAVNSSYGSLRRTTSPPYARGIKLRCNRNTPKQTLLLALILLRLSLQAGQRQQPRCFLARPIVPA